LKNNGRFNFSFDDIVRFNWGGYGVINIIVLASHGHFFHTFGFQKVATSVHEMPISHTFEPFCSIDLSFFVTGV
jgi:hypothetical protein